MFFIVIFANLWLKHTLTLTFGVLVHFEQNFRITGAYQCILKNQIFKFFDFNVNQSNLNSFFEGPLNFKYRVINFFENLVFQVYKFSLPSYLGAVFAENF